MFSFKQSKESENHLNISLKWTKHDCDEFVRKMLPLAIQGALSFVLIEGFKNILVKSATSRIMPTTIHTTICVCSIGVAFIPMTSLIQTLRSDGFGGFIVLLTKPHEILRDYRMVNTYGLFRRMTGVGHARNYHGEGTQNESGWGGLDHSIVERPEIILEGLFRRENTWKELNFRWKPGDVMKRPRQVAPYQPRVSYIYLHQLLLLWISLFLMPCLLWTMDESSLIGRCGLQH